MKKDPEEVVAVLFRIPRELVEGLEREAEKLSERAGGVPVSRNAALVSLLKRSLVVRKRKKLHDVEKGSTAATVRKYQQVNDRAEVKESVLQRTYGRLHEQGRVANTTAAKAIGVSEATMRRWARGVATLDADKARALEEFVAGISNAMRAQPSLLNEDSDG